MVEHVALQCGDDGLAQPRAYQQMERSVIDYGNAIKDLVAANIAPGDPLWKNFGVPRGGKVVFDDYDEIEYLTDCHFRRTPAPCSEEDAMSGEVWYSVGPRDVFPETFAPFLLGNDAVRDVFMRHHTALLAPAFWQSHQARIRAGQMFGGFRTTARGASRTARRRSPPTPIHPPDSQGALHDHHHPRPHRHRRRSAHPHGLAAG